MRRHWPVLVLSLLVWMPSSRNAQAQGLVPQGETLFYQRFGSSGDSTATRFFGASFSDSTIYAGVDSVVQRRDEVIPSHWNPGYQDGLVQWFLNSDASNSAANEVRLVGFQRPGLRVFYEPPLPWMASADSLAAGKTTWVWEGIVWPASGTGLPDSLSFSAAWEDSVPFPDGRSRRPGWRVVVSGPASVMNTDGSSLDLAGRVVALSGTRPRLLSTQSWFGSFEDGSGRWLLLLDGQVAFQGSQPTPIRKESFGAWRARYLQRSPR